MGRKSICWKDLWTFQNPQIRLGFTRGGEEGKRTYVEVVNGSLSLRSAAKSLDLVQYFTLTLSHVLVPVHKNQLLNSQKLCESVVTLLVALHQPQWE